MQNPIDNLVKYGEGTTTLKKNSKMINLDKKIFWRHVSVSSLEVHMFHYVLGELKWIKQIGNVRINEGQTLLYERFIGLIFVNMLP